MIPAGIGSPASPYEDLAAAQAAIADYTADCIVFMPFVSGITPNTLAGSVTSSTQVVVSGDIDIPTAAFAISITVPAGTTLSVPWTGSIP